MVVIGAGGSGKTSFAKALAGVLGLPHVELDALSWGPNWTGLGGSPEGDARFRARIQEATAGGAWVVDGSYSVARDFLWPQSDAIVWLDYPLPLVMWRLLRRSIARSLRRELLWGTNRESLRLLFFSRESLLYYTPRTHRARRRRFEQRLAQPDVSHVPLHRFRSPAAASAWLESLSPQP